MAKEAIEKAREKAFEDIRKSHGKGAIMRLGQNDAVDKIEVISTGTTDIDDLTGIGGFPRGKIVEVYGPECVAEDTFVLYSVITNGRRSNHKGGTIKRLYERFHKLPSDGNGSGKYQRQVTENAEFYAPCINEKDRILGNKIKNVIHSGRKECYMLTAGGYEILATGDHMFYTGEGQYKPLKQIGPGSTIFLHLNTPFRVKKHKDSSRNRIDLYVKHHPVAGTKIIRAIVNQKTKEKADYTYHRLARARAVVEAGLNKLTLGEYVDRLNAGNLEDLTFLTKEQHVHHKDENEANDVLDNLQVISAEEHGRFHALERHNNLRFVVTPAIVTTMIPCGVRDTYDIQMESPHNNYVANNFVVHNSSGKSTLALQVVAQAQKNGGLAAYIDVENAVDPTYSTALGVDIENLDFSQPTSGEEALEITLRLIESHVYSVIVVDSVAALVPRAELEGDMGDSVMGLQARLMSQAMRKLNKAVADSGTCLIFINQVRSKIGIVFGNPETTTGGVALKFYSSLRVSVHKSTVEKNSEGAYGQEVKVKIEKNKFAPPLKEAKISLRFGEGFVNAEKK